MRLARVPPASLPNPGRIALVTTLYREILNRALDPASQIYRLQELATGVSPAAVAREIFDSPEHRTLQRQRKAPRISLRTAIRDALKAERTASGLTS